MRWLVIILIGCQGEAVSETVPADAASGVDTGTCAPLTGNLVADGSFEQWEGAWDGPITKVGDGYHCSSAARFASTSYGGFRQLVSFGKTLPIGSEIELSAATKWISGSTRPIAFNLYFRDASGADINTKVTAAPLSGFRADGAWHLTVQKLVVTGAPASALFYIVSETSEPQTVDVDQVSVRLP